MSFAVASLSFLYFLVGSLDLQGQRLGVYPWADCTRIIQVAYGFKNTGDGFDWSEAPVIFTGFVSFPLPGRNDGCASWLVSVREGSFCIYFHAFYHSLYSYKFWVCFFFAIFFLQLENSSSNNFCTIFSSAFHRQYTKMHTWLATVAPIR